MRMYMVPTADGGRVMVTAETVVNACRYGDVQKCLALIAEGFGEAGICFETGLRLFEVRAIADHFNL